MSRIFKISTFTIDLESITAIDTSVYTPIVHLHGGITLKLNKCFVEKIAEVWEEYIESKEVEQKSEGNITHCEAEERCRSLLNWLVYDIGEETGSEKII